MSKFIILALLLFLGNELLIVPGILVVMIALTCLFALVRLKRTDWIQRLRFPLILLAALFMIGGSILLYLGVDEFIRSFLLVSEF